MLPKDATERTKILTPSPLVVRKWERSDYKPVALEIDGPLSGFGY